MLSHYVASQDDIERRVMEVLSPTELQKAFAEDALPISLESQ